MTGPTHMLVGVASVLALGRVLGEAPDGMAFFVGIIGALAPDIDGNGSITRPGNLARRMLPGRFISSFVVRVLNISGRTLGFVVRRVVRHRGFFHWPILPICMFVTAHWYSLPLLLYFAIGYLSHILADACTVSGVPLLAPISKRSYRIARIRTGGFGEALFSVGVALAIGMFLGVEEWFERLL